MTSANPTHPFTLDIVPSRNADGTFEWTIHRHGKLLERSDRTHRSEQDARKNGQKALERAFQADRSVR